MKYSSRGDLLIAAGESVKMQEAEGIEEPVCKLNTVLHVMLNLGYFESNDYEFPLAVIEGKPVFVGDELYSKLNGTKYTINSHNYAFDTYSWLPPKPKTVMVELRIDVAERMAHDETMVSEHLAMACRKALEELK